MSRIISPTVTADNPAYTGLKDLASITSTNAEIDANPLFQLAENFIATKLPDSVLRSPTEPEKGRTFPQRPSVISALQFLAASYMLRGGGSVGGETVTEGSGALKSESTRLGPVETSKSYDVGSSSSRQSAGDVSDTDRADWLEKQGLAILEGLGVNVSDVTSDGEVTVGLTRSRLC